MIESTLCQNSCLKFGCFVSKMKDGEYGTDCLQPWRPSYWCNVPKRICRSSWNKPSYKTQGQRKWTFGANTGLSLSCFPEMEQLSFWRRIEPDSALQPLLPTPQRQIVVEEVSLFKATLWNNNTNPRVHVFGEIFVIQQCYWISEQIQAKSLDPVIRCVQLTAAPALPVWTVMPTFTEADGIPFL